MTIKGSLIKRNIAANLIGTGVVTLLTLVITPLQIKILGIEAYGIVGFIVTLQVIFAVFDLGLSSTLTRELAIDSSPNKVTCRSLISTVSGVYWLAAISISILIIVFAEPISHWWFHQSEISQDTLTFSVRVIGLYLGLRWPVAMYAGILSGLQHMQVLNIVKVGITIFRLGGGIGVLLIWRNLDIFLIWVAISGLFELGCYWFACRRAFPDLSLFKYFSIDEIKRVWKFSFGMNALSILAIIIVQMDRLMISKLNTLEILGYYSLAYMAVTGLSLVLSSISSAALPWLANSLQSNNKADLVSRYEKSSLLILLAVGFFACAMVFYPYLLLSIWVDKNTALNASNIFLLLALGTWLSAINTNLYNVAIASGQPYWHLRVNLILIAPYTATLYFLIENFGGVGAAIGWILLNLGYILLLSKAVSVNILRIKVSKLFIEIVFPSLFVAFVSYVPFKIFSTIFSFEQSAELLILLLSSSLYLLIGYLVLPKTLKVNLFGRGLKNIF